MAAFFVDNGALTAQGGTYIIQSKAKRHDCEYLMHELSLLDPSASVEIAYDGGVTRSAVRVYKYNKAVIIEVPS